MLFSCPIHAKETQESWEKVEYVELLNEGETLNEEDYEEVALYKTYASGYDQSHDDDILTQLLNMETYVYVQGYGFTTENVIGEMSKLVNRHPELYFLGKGFYFSKDANGNITKIKPIYAYTKIEVSKMNGEIQSAVDNFYKEYDITSMSKEEKVLAVHDYLVSSITYEKTETNRYNLYGALVEKKCVCQGYAQAMEYLLTKAGVTCGVATSDTAEHAWNVVKIGSHWYHCDPTWDDFYDYPGRVTHDNLLLSNSSLLNSFSERKDYVCCIPDKTVIFSTPDDKTYEKGFWNESISKILYYKGNWYYGVDKEFHIIKYDYTSKKETLFYENEEEYWFDTYTTAKNKLQAPVLARKENILYFTAPTAIYQINLNGGKETAFYRPTEIYKGSDLYRLVYGLDIINENVMYYIGCAIDDEPVGYTAPSEHIHTFTEKERLAATCTKSGKIEYICSICGETKTELIAATGHENTEKRNIKEATCSTNGYTGDVYCRDCGTKLSGGTFLSKTAHTWDKGEVIKPADCVHTGVRTYTCKICHEQKEENLKKTEHSWDDGKITTAPTTSSVGIKTFICKVCGTTKTEEISKLSVEDKTRPNKPTNTKNNPKDIIWDKKTTSSTKKEQKTVKKPATRVGTVFVYKKQNYKIIKVRKEVSFIHAERNKREIVIPATVRWNGVTYKVTAIAAKAVKNNKKVKSVTIGANVKKIANNTFFKCPNLKKVTLKSVKIIKVNKKAFKGVNKNLKIKISKKVCK